MDFYTIRVSEPDQKSKGKSIYPDFRVARSADLMVRGKAFYAIWDAETGLWSTDEYEAQRLVDADLLEFKNSYYPDDSDVRVRYMAQFDSGSWGKFKRYLATLADNAVQLDSKLVFANTNVRKKDYVSKRLPYPLEKGECPAYHELMDTLYDPEERRKLEWAIGSIVAGASRDIQKFIVLYGEVGSGKSTVINIIQQLFEGYYTTFEAKALGSANNQFSTEAFRSSPLVAIQHDGDLSGVTDNTKLNSIISHEEMIINEKNKPTYMAKVNAFLFMGTNKPVKITDSKSGIIRRLIDVTPSGRKLAPKHYQALISQIAFESGAIAYHCLEVFNSMGKDYYSSYRPLAMMYETDVFFNYIESNSEIFESEPGITLAQAYELYKQYCLDSSIEHRLPRHKFREELRSYFTNFEDRAALEDGTRVRSWFTGFISEKLLRNSWRPLPKELPSSLVMDDEASRLDILLGSQPAQYASDKGIPTKKWADVTTTLDDLDTTRVHYVKCPENHIVIDFDIIDPETGEKSMEMNLEAAALWPPTYTEFSKSGKGVHLHYIYDGDASELSRVFDDHVEIKVFSGDASLRRKLTRCRNIDVAHISGGLPLKEKRMIDTTAIKKQGHIRALIMKNLRKEIHPGTKPSIDFIHKILEDAYASGEPYDVTDLKGKVLSFAANSTNQAAYCLGLVSRMKFRSEADIAEYSDAPVYDTDRIVYFDTEVFPNLFVLCWKYEDDDTVVRLINPRPAIIEDFMKLKLVGFNNRQYDNHIIYARYLGYTNAELYKLSQKIVSNNRDALFAEAYGISYADVYGFTSKPQSLKKYEIELGIKHQELGLPWDEPVDEKLWTKVADYCANDVVATEAVAKARKDDFVARQILASLSGLRVNDSTARHTARILFGTDKKPQDEFVYTDLSEMFPGYKYDYGKSTYRGETVGEGGYVHAVPGMYNNVAVLDVASMHPTSIEQLNLFGPYTKNFSELKEARLAIKHREFDKARKMMDGKFADLLDDVNNAEALSFALKIVINTVYGLTAASFENPFRDLRNVDNIVAKRGALFMLDLKAAVIEKGYNPIHIKTDSIKIPDADEEIINFVTEFGAKYGYVFEMEDTYERMCLVNDAVYIAKHANGEWVATGAQFAHPIVNKTLFNRGQAITQEDYFETKAVTTAIYLDMNEGQPDDVHDYKFVGSIGRFVPVLPGNGGGVLLREKDGKYYAVGGSKGYRWLEAYMLQSPDQIDKSYANSLVTAAIESVSKYGDFDTFTKEA